MYHIRPHLRLHVFHYLKNKELDELYFSVGIRVFAESMILIFVPVYLLTLGYLFQDIVIFFAILYITMMVLYPISSISISKIGIKKTMSMGLIFLIMYNLLLDQVAFGIPYQYAAILWGISSALYYVAFHIDFSMVSDRKKEGSEFSRIKILAIVSAAFGPLVGAVLISEISYTFVFLFVSVLLLFSAFPLFLSKDKKIRKPVISMSRIRKSGTKKLALASQGMGIIDFSSAFLWPLFIFIVLGEVVQLGMIVTLTSIMLIIFLYYIGKLSDRHEKKTLKIGIGVHSVSWLTRIFFLTPVGMFLNNFYAALSYSLIEISYYKIVYERARKVKDIANYFIFREINTWLGRMLVLIIAFIVADIRWVFVIMFLGTFMFTALLKKPEKVVKNKYKK